MHSSKCQNTLSLSLSLSLSLDSNFRNYHVFDEKVYQTTMTKDKNVHNESIAKNDCVKSSQQIFQCHSDGLSIHLNATDWK